MHNDRVTGFHALVVPVAAHVAIIILLIAHSPMALSQSASPSSNAPPNGAGQVRTAPAANSQSLLVTVPEDFATLKLAPGFLLNVQVYDEPDFSGHIRVDGDGNIKIPFLNALHVAGNTAAQTRDQIRQLFRDEGILTNPQITVDVEQFATTSATVLGEVQNPGKIELLTPHSLLDVIGLTGGETPLASVADFVVGHGPTAINRYDRSRRVTIEAEQPLLGECGHELDRKERIAAGLLVHQPRQRDGTARRAAKCIRNEPSQIFVGERRKTDLLHKRSRLADSIERAQKRMRGTDLIVPVRADQQ